MFDEVLKEKEQKADSRAGEGRARWEGSAVSFPLRPPHASRAVGGRWLYAASLGGCAQAASGAKAVEAARGGGGFESARSQAQLPGRRCSHRRDRGPSRRPRV